MVVFPAKAGMTQSDTSSQQQQRPGSRIAHCPLRDGGPGTTTGSSASRGNC
jgi:hypothetical protein